ncbi:hypothetical protein [Methylobacter sp.]|uniref:hypothetical protein n=1 Tax=Methylobacter sp. TaxID=2051955 RepID=UPI002FDD3EBA
MFQYIVFEQFLNQDCTPFGGGHASNPVSIQEAAKRYRAARDFRNGSTTKGCSPVKVGVVRVPSDYSGFTDFKGSFQDICSFRPQVSVICR